MFLSNHLAEQSIDSFLIFQIFRHACLYWRRRLQRMDRMRLASHERQSSIWAQFWGQSNQMTSAVAMRIACRRALWMPPPNRWASIWKMIKFCASQCIRDGCERIWARVKPHWMWRLAPRQCWKHCGRWMSRTMAHWCSTMARNCHGDWWTGQGRILGIIKLLKIEIRSFELSSISRSPWTFLPPS